MNGLLQPIISWLFLGKKNPRLLKNSDYKRSIPVIRKLYAQTWRWHGTGRFHYHKDNIIDVLKEIIEKDGLIPHKDSLDYTRGPVYTISLSPSRTYSTLYAQIHYQRGSKIRKPLQTFAGWFYYIGHIVWSAVLNDQRLFSKNFRDKHKLNYEGNAFFRDKIYKKDPGGVRGYINGGVSDIKGNYPLLIAIKKGAFKEARIAKVYGRHESRSETHISISNFTHIEVPLQNAREVKETLVNSGVNTPVIPIEWEEEFSKSQPISFLKEGFFRKSK